MAHCAREMLYILGIRIDCLTLDQILFSIDQFVSQKTPHQIITANALMVLAAQKNPELKQAFDQTDLVIPDSIGVVLAARLLHQRAQLCVPARIPGIDLMGHLCQKAAQNTWKVFFLGAKPGVAEKTSQNLHKKYPGFLVAGWHDGYFIGKGQRAKGLWQEQEVIQKIAQAEPDLLFVAMDVPRQDIWIRQSKNKLNAKVIIGVGGSFDVLSGQLKRAPRLMRKIGLEWLFRLIQEPRRIFRMLKLPVFAFLVLKEALCRQKNI